LTEQTIQNSQSQESQSAATGQEAQGAAGSTTTSTGPVRPDGLPDRFWDATAGVKTADLIKTIADADAARAALPADAAAYKIEVPGASDIAKKFGVQPDAIKLNEADPLLGQFREFAHKAGMSQEAFGQALNLFVESQFGQSAAAQQAFKDSYTTEMKKLGDNSTGRVAAATAFLVSHLGEDAGKAFATNMITAADVEAIEKLQKAFSDQGAKTAPGGGASTSDPKTLTDEQRASMTPAERLVFARKASGLIKDAA
jgi:hypothetical protein